MNHLLKELLLYTVLCALAALLWLPLQSVATGAPAPLPRHCDPARYAPHWCVGTWVSAEGDYVMRFGPGGDWLAKSLLPRYEGHVSEGGWYEPGEEVRTEGYCPACSRTYTGTFQRVSQDRAVYNGGTYARTPPTRR
jgi:hypothetical protein